MPGRQEHLAQAARNGKLADTLSSTEYLDWAVTAYFYAGVHLVESYLDIHGYHSRDHGERNEHIRAVPQLRAVFKEYQALKTLSHQARYQVMPISPVDVETAKGKLRIIRAQIEYVTTGKKA